MTTSKLIFFPADTQDTISNEIITGALDEIQFIITPSHGDNHYLPGDNFLSLLTFLGCSPNINLSPTDNEDHCHISLIKQTDNPQCLGYTRTCNPKCPHCTKRISNWKTGNWQLAGSTCLCDKCGMESNYDKLNWKQECGFGRCGFEVAHIYPHEAVPTDQLINALKKKTGFDWKYCYSNN